MEKKVYLIDLKVDSDLRLLLDQLFRGSLVRPQTVTPAKKEDYRNIISDAAAIVIYKRAQLLNIPQAISCPIYLYQVGSPLIELSNMIAEL